MKSPETGRNLELGPSILDATMNAGSMAHLAVALSKPGTGALLLEHLRWPEGFACRECGHESRERLGAGAGELVSCRGCGQVHDLRKETVFALSDASLASWFELVWMVVTAQERLVPEVVASVLGEQAPERLAHIVQELVAVLERLQPVLGEAVQVDAFELGRSDGWLLAAVDEQQAAVVRWVEELDSATVDAFIERALPARCLVRLRASSPLSINLMGQRQLVVTEREPKVRAAGLLGERIFEAMSAWPSMPADQVSGLSLQQALLNDGGWLEAPGEVFVRYLRLALSAGPAARERISEIRAREDAAEPVSEQCSVPPIDQQECG